MVSVTHGLAKGVPGVRVALKTVQQDERGISWASPLDVVELQAIDGDKLILSEGGQAHRSLLSEVVTRLGVGTCCFHTPIMGTCQGTRKLRIRLCTCKLPRAILQVSGKMVRFAAAWCFTYR